MNQITGISVTFLVILIIIFLSILAYFIPVRLWIAALAAGVRVTIFNLIGMRLRRVTPTTIILPKIKLSIFVWDSCT